MAARSSSRVSALALALLGTAAYLLDSAARSYVGAPAAGNSFQPPPYAAAAVDVGAAVAASMAVAPFIFTIDRAIVEAAAGRTGLFRGILSGCISILRRPRKALFAIPSYWMVTGVYAATYACANMIDTSFRHQDASPAVHGAAKLFGTTAVNMIACIAKDVAFARMYGAQGLAGKMPLMTIGLFGARDLLTIASAFTMPSFLAAAFASSGMEPGLAEDAAQMVLPVVMQVFCAPIHLLALNFYNMPSATARARVAAVAATAPETIVAYAIRMAPAFGIGGVMNIALTSNGHEALRQRYAVIGGLGAEV